MHNKSNTENFTKKKLKHSMMFSNKYWTVTSWTTSKVAQWYCWLMGYFIWCKSTFYAFETIVVYPYPIISNNWIQIINFNYYYWKLRYRVELEANLRITWEYNNYTLPIFMADTITKYLDLQVFYCCKT